MRREGGRNVPRLLPRQPLRARAPGMSLCISRLEHSLSRRLVHEKREQREDDLIVCTLAVAAAARCASSPLA